MDELHNRLLIIAGMHRSGTSLITQWLQKCGLDIGDELMQANVGNEQGYFEDMNFVRLHEELLRHNKLSSTGLTDKHITGLPATDKERISLLLLDKSLRHSQWGWKDPRTCLFLNIYRKLVPEAKYVIIYRDCNFCVRSLINRMLKDEKIEYYKSRKKHARLRWKWYKKAITLKHFLRSHAEDFLKVWLHYNEELLHHIELLGRDQYLVIDYHFLLSNDKAFFDFLTNTWDFQLTYLPFNKVYNHKLMSKEASISRYVTDKKLLPVVSALEDKLKTYFFLDKPIL